MPVFRFGHLKDKAKEVQGGMVSDIKIDKTKQRDVDKYQQALAASKTTKEPTARDVVDYLLYVGLDLKGQIQMASEAHGFGASGEVSVNPFGLVGLNTEIGASGSIKGSKQRTIVVSRGPSEVTVAGKQEKVHRPIVVNSILGKYWEAKGQLSLDVSVGVEASAGVSPTKEGTAPTSKAEHSFKSELGSKDSEPPPSGYEAVGACASAKAGFKAEAGYTYDHFYGEDVYPLRTARQERAKRWLELLLREGSTKTMFKLRACELINDEKNQPHFGNKKIDLHGKVLWHTTTKGHEEIVKRLSELKPSAPPELQADVKALIEKLQRWDHPGDGSCFLRLSSHKGGGKAGLYAQAEAKAAAGGLVSAGVNAEAFAGISGEYKKAFARFQNMVTTAKHTAKAGGVSFGTVGGTTIYTTYDSAITYSSFALGLEFGLDAKFNVVGYGKSLSSDTSLGDKLDKAKDKLSWKPNRLNQIRYVCAIATWARPLPGFARGLKAGSEKEGEVLAIKGTGFAIGQSFAVGNLVKFYESQFDATAMKFKDTAADASYAKILAIALGISDRKTLLSFLADPYVASTILEFLPLDVGVFLEATYRIDPLPRIKVKMGIEKETGQELIQLDKAFGKGFKSAQRTLESIRLRYRKRDVFNKDSTIFTAGFKVAGTGFKISLEKVDRAGADGIVDVATVFVSPDLKGLADASPTQAAAYEQAVPPAALFCQ